MAAQQPTQDASNAMNATLEPKSETKQEPKTQYPTPAFLPQLKKHLSSLQGKDIPDFKVPSEQLLAMKSIFQLFDSNSGADGQIEINERTWGQTLKLCAEEVQKIQQALEAGKITEQNEQQNIMVVIDSFLNGYVNAIVTRNNFMFENSRDENQIHFRMMYNGFLAIASKLGITISSTCMRKTSYEKLDDGVILPSASLSSDKKEVPKQTVKC